MRKLGCPVWVEMRGGGDGESLSCFRCDEHWIAVEAAKRKFWGVGLRLVRVICKS